MLMTVRSAGIANLRILPSSLRKCPPVLTRSQRRWRPIVFDYMLHHAKTEVLWCSSSRRQYQIPSDPVRIGSTDVQPVSSVRDLGVYIDANMSVRTHATAIVRSCFATLRQIRSRSLPCHALLTLIRALVVSKVDYCNSVLAGVSRSCKTGCSLF